MTSPTKIDEILKRSGEMGRLTREKDWATTELGPIESWPQSLLTAMSICLASGSRSRSTPCPKRSSSGDGNLCTRYLNVIYEPLRGEAGRVDGIMAFAHEVTEQVIARREVERLARAAEAASITKSRFLANMSHEIRTPLGVILDAARLSRRRLLRHARPLRRAR